MKENGTGIIGYTQLLLLNEVLFFGDKVYNQIYSTKEGEKIWAPNYFGRLIF